MSGPRIVYVCANCGSQIETIVGGTHGMYWVHSHSFLMGCELVATPLDLSTPQAVAS